MTKRVEMKDLKMKQTRGNCNVLGMSIVRITDEFKDISRHDSVAFAKELQLIGTSSSTSDPKDDELKEESISNENRSKEIPNNCGDLTLSRSSENPQDPPQEQSRQDLDICDSKLAIGKQVRINH